jgi:hypothetical protein
MRIQRQIPRSVGKRELLGSRSYPPNRRLPAFGDIEITGGPVDREARNRSELQVPVEAAGRRHLGHDPPLQAPDRGVAGISDVQGSRPVQRQPRRRLQRRRQRHHVVLGRARDSRPGDLRHMAIGRKTVDAVAAEVRDVELAGGVHHDVPRRIQLRLGGPHRSAK